MLFKLKENAKYSLIVPTSMGVRITPLNRQSVHSSDSFRMQVTSAETNVASVASYLGMPVKVLTTFVKESPIARMIKDDLASRHMDYEGQEVSQGNPWGYRHQINIADDGYGPRGPRVWNDRAGEVGRTLNVSDFDVEKIFEKEGTKVLHISGLIAALSPETGKFCLEIAKSAKKHGTLITFDLNYRASFWENRKDELKDTFTQIAEITDILLGNEEDYQMSFGISGPESHGVDIKSGIEDYKEMIKKVRKIFPNVSVYGTTLRQVIDANTHMWGALLLAGEEWQVVEPRKISVLDRIGGGDGFVGGLLYSVMKGWEPEKWIKFAWACGALAVTSITDYCQPADEEQIWSIWEGNARVKR